MLVRQGPHQVAQNSTTYVRSASNWSISSPLTHSETARAGASSPMLRVCAEACQEATPRNVKARQYDLIFMADSEWRGSRRGLSPSRESTQRNHPRLASPIQIGNEFSQRLPGKVERSPELGTGS